MCFASLTFAFPVPRYGTRRLADRWAERLDMGNDGEPSQLQGLNRQKAAECNGAERGAMRPCRGYPFTQPTHGTWLPLAACSCAGLQSRLRPESYVLCGVLLR